MSKEEHQRLFKPQSRLDKSMVEFSTIVGAVVGATSLFSLITRTFDLGIGILLEDFITYYREVTTVIASAFEWILPFKFPKLLIDLWIVASVITFTDIRMKARVSHWTSQKVKWSKLLSWSKTICYRMFEILSLSSYFRIVTYIYPAMVGLQRYLAAPI
ncbi:MAG: hypothetical protein AAFQ84_01910, partial [Pseudomonadota bacterium]